MAAVGEASPAPVLPAGGAAGQYLTRTAGGATAWTTPAAAADIAPPYASGLWYNTRYTGGQNSTAFIAQVGFTRYFPHFNPRAVTITAVALNYNTATTTTSVLTFAVLRSAVTNGTANVFPGIVPSTLLAAATSTPMPSTTGVVTITTALTIPAGWVFFAYGNSGATYTLTGYGPAVPLQLPVTTTQAPHSGSSSGACSYIAGGATPVNNPPTANITTGASGPPTLWFKAA